MVSQKCLLDVVAGQLLTEAGGGAILVLGLVQAGNGGVQRGAGHQILLEGHLVGGVSLRLGTGAEAHAGDAVAALNGHAVGGEGPLVGEGTALALGGGQLGGHQALVAPQAVVGVHQRLNVGSGLLIDPGGEEALGLVDVARPCRTVIHVHGHLHVLGVLLAGGQILDLLQAGLVGLAGGHAAVDGDGAAIRHGAAGGGGVPRMRATYMEAGNMKEADIISTVKKGIYCDQFTNGQVQIGAGDFTFFVKSGYLIEDGKLTQPVKDINIIGNGPKALADITMVANNDKIDNGTWTCGKDGQSCPVTCGMPSALVSKLTVGGES